MARRFLFISRARFEAGGDFGSPELRNPEREVFLFRRRLGLAGALVFIAFCALVARFFYLQVIEHRHYQTLAETNRIAIVPSFPIAASSPTATASCSRRATPPTRSRSSPRA